MNFTQNNQHEIQSLVSSGPSFNPWPLGKVSGATTLPSGHGLNEIKVHSLRFDKNFK